MAKALEEEPRRRRGLNALAVLVMASVARPFCEGALFTRQGRASLTGSSFRSCSTPYLRQEKCDPWDKVMATRQD
jgi:hypothetical protein